MLSAVTTRSSLATKLCQLLGGQVVGTYLAVLAFVASTAPVRSLQPQQAIHSNSQLALTHNHLQRSSDTHKQLSTHAYVSMQADHTLFER